MNTIVGDYVDPESVALARTRLMAFAERHDIDLERYGAFARQDDAGWVDSALSEIYDLTHTDPVVSYAKPRSTYHQAVNAFRRAIGHPRATFLHISNGCAYAAW